MEKSSGLGKQPNASGIALNHPILQFVLQLDYETAEAVYNELRRDEQLAGLFPELPQPGTQELLDVILQADEKKKNIIFARLVARDILQRLTGQAERNLDVDDRHQVEGEQVGMEIQEVGPEDSEDQVENLNSAAVDATAEKKSKNKFERP